MLAWAALLAVAARGAVAVIGVLAIAAAISTTVSALLAGHGGAAPAVMAFAGILRGRPMGGPLAGALVGRGDRNADQPLDIAQERRFLVIAERDRHAVGAGARGAADAVHVRSRDVRQIVIDHMADAVDVDAAGGDVGGDQDAQLAARGSRRARARAGSATCCRGSPRRRRRSSAGRGPPCRRRAWCG